MTWQLNTRSSLDRQLSHDMAIDVPRGEDSPRGEPGSGAESDSKIDKPGLQSFASLVTVNRRFKSGATVTKQRYRTQPADFVGMGIMILAAGAVLVALALAIGFVLGKIDGDGALKMIATCLGGSTIAIVAGAVTRRPFPARSEPASSRIAAR